MNPDEFPHTQNEDNLFIDDATPLQVNQIHQSLNPKLFPQQDSSLKKNITHSEYGSQVLCKDSKKKSFMNDNLDNDSKKHMKSSNKSKAYRTKN